MREKKKIIEEHKKLIEEIKKHNNFYFVKDRPEISDAEYDKIKKMAFNLENRYPFLKKKDSVYTIVGAAPSNQFKNGRPPPPGNNNSKTFV